MYSVMAPLGKWICATTDMCVVNGLLALEREEPKLPRSEMHNITSATRQAMRSKFFLQNVASHRCNIWAGSSIGQGSVLYTRDERNPTHVPQAAPRLMRSLRPLDRFLEHALCIGNGKAAALLLTRSSDFFGHDWSIVRGLFIWIYFRYVASRVLSRYVCVVVLAAHCTLWTVRSSKLPTGVRKT